MITPQSVSDEYEVENEHFLANLSTSTTSIGIVKNNGNAGCDHLTFYYGCK